MRLNIQNYFGWTTLALAAIGSWYFMRMDAEDNFLNERGRDFSLGYYINDAKLLGLDEEGQALYQITAKRLETRGEAGGLLLEEVRVEYRPHVDIAWFLTATRGEAPRNETYLDLQGRVELVRQPENEGNGTIIQTERLRLQPEDFIATTNETVRIHLGQDQINATGMRAYLKDNRLELESNVHGQFSP